MALVLADRVRETTNTSGTGTLTLLGAVTGYQTFSSAIGNGNTCYYSLSATGSSLWEVGIGTVSAGALARTTILSGSSGAGVAITLPGTTFDVFVTYPASQSVNYDGAGSVGIGIAPTGLDILEIAAGTTAKAPLGFTSGALLNSPDVGSVEFDGNNWYMTPSTTEGRTTTVTNQQFILSAAGSAIGPTIANFFGANSAASLLASTTYEIQCHCYFLKTTAGTATWSPTFSSAVTVAHSILDYTPVGGFTTANISGAMVTAEATQQTVTAMTYAATGTLTTAVYHIAKFNIRVTTNAACNFRLNLTQSAGTATPQAGSWYTVKKLNTTAGNFVA